MQHSITLITSGLPGIFPPAPAVTQLAKQKPFSELGVCGTFPKEETGLIVALCVAYSAHKITNHSY
jgi:hypothetical protein